MEENVAPQPKAPEIYKLFSLMNKRNASVLHLKHNCNPILRVQGTIQKAEVNKLLTGKDILTLAKPIILPRQMNELEETGGATFSHNAPDIGHFFLSIFKQRGEYSLVIKRVATSIPSFMDLNLPRSVAMLTEQNSGLVIIAGNAGSGKSNTLAALIDLINMNEQKHIVTIEDPIEFVFNDRNSFITQREIGSDLEDYVSGMKFVARQDPDVVVLGDLTNRETFLKVMDLCEAGKLVMGTMNASSSAQAITKIISLYTTEERAQIRQRLSLILKAISCQILLPSAREGLPFVPAVEVLINDNSIKKILRDGADEKISDAVRGGKKSGMLDFNTSLLELRNKKLITDETAIEASPNPEALRMNLKGIFTSDSTLL